LQISHDISVRKEKDILDATGNITMEDVVYRCMNILTEEEDIDVINGAASVELDRKNCQIYRVE